MITIPNRLFERSIEDIEIGISDIHLYTKKEIEDAQKGYRIDENGNEIKDWIGDNYIVIGDDSCCGDPIIAKIDEDELPIYSMFHDDWDSLEIIAKNFEQYIQILEKIEDIDLENKNECENFLEEIKEIIPDKAYDYWEALIKTANEFLTE